MNNSSSTARRKAQRRQSTNDGSTSIRETAHCLYGGHELINEPIAVDAEGIYVVDYDGRRYVDCASGTFDQPLGHKHPAIVEAVCKQMSTLAYVASPFLSTTLLKLAEKLTEIAPPHLKKVHLRDLTGSTAVEGAVKIAQVATGKRDIITVFGSHHGQTALTTDLSGNAFRRANYPGHNTGCLQVPAPNCYRCFYHKQPATCGMTCIDKISDFIEYASSGSVAAMIIEPIQGNGGNVMPPRGYFKKLRRLCDQQGMLLILDEVQTAFGRLGYMLGAEYFEAEPHIIVLAKGLSGPVPRGAILVQDGLEKMPRYQHSFTGGSSLLSAAAALATIEVLERPGFLPRVRSTGEHIGERLQALKNRFAFIGDVRGTGFMWGIELVREDGFPDIELCNRAVHSARQFGLILRSSRYGHGSVLKIRPALVMTYAEADDMLDRLELLLGSLS